MTDSTSTPCPEEAPDALLWRRWKGGERVEVCEFLAGLPPLPTTDLVAVLLLDQSERWKAGERVPAEAYVGRYPELQAAAEAVVEMAYGEFLLREERGERPDLREYLWRFPGHEARLRQQVELHLALRADTSPVEPATEQETLHRASDVAPIRPFVPGYEVLGELGRGGMGVVYKARQVKADRTVALKVIRAGGHAAAAETARFRREAESIARLKHPNIVQVFEVGEYDGLPFFSLELCPGGNLEKKLGGSPMPAPAAAALVERLALGVEEAHRNNVVHRDLKPANVLLAEDGTPKVSDFGLARRLDEDSQTQTGSLLGTPSYMAPEQARGDVRGVGPVADVYSLGAILYECLTGRPPFRAATYPETILQVLGQEPEPPRRSHPATPRDLETICLKCLQKDPARRYPGAGQLAEDLRRFQEDRPILARRSSAAERAWRWCRRNRLVAGLAAAVFALLASAATGGLLLSHSRGVALDKATAAEREANEKLFESYVSGADAKRMSNRPGQRFDTLDLVRNALKVSAVVGLSDKDRLRLRNIAIAALCLPDVGLERRWPRGPDKPMPEDLDPLLRRRVLTHDAARRVPPPNLDGLFECHDREFSSPDGRFVAIHNVDPAKLVDHPFRLWRVDGPEPVPGLDDPKGAHLFAAAFHPDGKRMAVGRQDGSVSLYDLDAAKEILHLPPQPKPCGPMAFHPRLPLLAVAYDGGEVAFWDVVAGRRVGKSLSHPGGLSAIAWHPRGHRLATGCGRLIRLWDAETRSQVTEPWRGHLSGGGINLSFSPSGDRVVSNDWDLTLRLWDSAGGRLLLSRPNTPMAHFDSSGRSLGPLNDGESWTTLRVSGGQEMRAIRRFKPDGDERLVAFSLHPGGRLLVGQTPTGTALFDLLTGEALDFVRMDLPSRGYAKFDRSGALWTVGAAGLLRWPTGPSPSDPSRLRVGPPEWVADASLGGHDGFAITDDGRSAVLPRYNEGALVVHRGPPGRTVRLGPQHDVRLALPSPDGRWVVTRTHDWGLANGIGHKVWDAETGRLAAELPISEVASVQGFSPDSRWLYARGKGDRRLEVASLVSGPGPASAPLVPGDEPRRQGGWHSEPMRLWGTFSSDGTLAAFGQSDGSVELVLTGNQEVEVARLPSPEVGRLVPGCFSPDGSLLLAQGVETGTVYVFDLRRIREQLAELGLDWDAPPCTPADPARDDPTRAPPLRVEVIGAEAAANRAAMAQYETRLAVARLAVNPLDAEANYRLGERMLQAGKLTSAHAHLSAALALRPDLDAARVPRLLAAYRLGRLDEAADGASRWLERCDFDRTGREVRARVRMCQGRHAEAIPDLSSLLGRYPTRAMLYAWRSRCHAALGRDDAAKADREEAAKLGLDDAALANEEAWELLTGPAALRDPRHALELIRPAVARRPENAMFRNTLGVAEYRNGLYREAAATLEKSLSAGKGESDGIDLFFLAMCHAKLQDQAKAKGCFDRAVRWQDGRKNLTERALEELESSRREAEQAMRPARP